MHPPYAEGKCDDFWDNSGYKNKINKKDELSTTKG
jgi:hypothetical protein